MKIIYTKHANIRRKQRKILTKFVESAISLPDKSYSSFAGRTVACKSFNGKILEVVFDEKADALYIQFQKGSVKKTLKVKEGILIDIDKNGRLFGIEILDVSHRIPQKSISDLNIHLPVKIAI